MKKAARTSVLLAMTAAMALSVNAVAQEAPTTTAPDAPTTPETTAEPVEAPVASAPEIQAEIQAAPQVEVQVQAAAPADGAFQVIRPGDSQMSCEALIAEANSLNAQMTEVQSQITERAMAMTRSQLRGMQTRQGMSTAMGLGSMAASFIPGAGLALGAAQSVAGLAQRADAAAQQRQRLDAIDDMMADAETGAELMMPLMNRADHLTDLSIAKGC